MRGSPQRVAKHIPHKVCHCRNGVVDAAKGCERRVVDSNKQIPDDCSRRSQNAHNNAGGRNARTCQLIERRHAGIKRPHKQHNAHYGDSDRVKRHDSVPRRLRCRHEIGRYCSCIGRHDISPERSGHTYDDGGNHIQVVCQQANGIQHRLQRLQGDILHHGPRLAPGHGHLLKGRVRFLCRVQHGVFHHVRRDGALAGHFPHLPDGDPHVVGDGLGDHGGLLQHAVELIAPQGAGCKGLGQLHHGGLGRLPRRARNGHLLLQLLGKGDQFVGAAESIGGQDAQLGHHVGHVHFHKIGCHIGAPGALRGLVDFILRGRGRLGAAGHELQAGVDLRHPVGCLHQLLHRLQAHIGPQQVLEMAGEGRRRRGGFVLCGRLFSLCTGGFSGSLGLQPFLRGKRGGLGSLCTGRRRRRIGFGRGQLVSGGGKPGALRDLRGGLLQLLGGCGALLNQLDILVECGRKPVFKRKRFFDDGHAITSRFWPFLPLSALCRGRIRSSRS